ncbi:MFS transporter [Desulforamulus hydrothermalis]|uniref:Major facilitator superfamily MFS_1 n=1 Tax=Desulforamulus hydrothermalis Lam5 = DSM 18033 TaxID=1121428 RepID=K8DY03_9FIRM|nr:MFS transporter [Desulforamulus hydrothermalis]CCO07520.1 Major facilitator superfamily MFS_1 [Desulforamulus hydrothermalis Lam5 = DSM 18033]SHH16627.1 Predicted arabinose efflux permease, MFS family [Desulforamulus hydrothermalis Lam5 = DSM 18033]
MSSKQQGCKGKHVAWAPLAALRHRNFRLFYAGQMISVIGFWMQNVAQAWVVLELTDSPFLLGLVTFVQFVPNLVFSLAAGVFADRFPRRKLVIGTQTGFMLTALLLTVLSGLGALRYWHILLISSLMGILHALDIPTRQAFLVEMVGREDLSNAIALNSSMFNAARVLGPACGGLVLAKYGATACFFINAVSYLFVIGGLLAMSIKQRIHPSSAKNMLSQIKDGIFYIKNTPNVRIPMTLLASVSISAMNFGVLVPVFARTVLGQGPDGFGMLVSSLGVGSLAGALILVVLGSNYNQFKFLWAGAAGLSLCQIMLGQVQFFWPAALLLAGAGWSMVSLSASVNSIIQMQVPDDLRGRVMSVYSLSFIGLSSIGGMLAGAVARWFGAATAFTGGGLLALLATIWLAKHWRAKAYS